MMPGSRARRDQFDKIRERSEAPISKGILNRLKVVLADKGMTNKQFTDYLKQDIRSPWTEGDA